MGRSGVDLSGVPGPLFSGTPLKHREYPRSRELWVDRLTYSATPGGQRVKAASSVPTCSLDVSPGLPLLRGDRGLAGSSAHPAGTLTGTHPEPGPCSNSGFLLG